jgi:hypothetical protein
MHTLDDIDREIKKFENVLKNAQNVIDRRFSAPGSFITGRSNRSGALDKQVDGENRRRAAAMRKAQHARAELSRLRVLRDDFITGERYASGQPRADAPIRKRRMGAEEAYALVICRLIKPGDNVILACNGAIVTIGRINDKSVTTTGGAKWGYSEIIPIVDGRPMTPKELAQEARKMVEQTQDAA